MNRQLKRQGIPSVQLCNGVMGYISRNKQLACQQNHSDGGVHVRGTKHRPRLMVGLDSESIEKRTNLP